MKEKNRPSLAAFIEQTARMLREAAAEGVKKTHRYAKETDLSNKNKIARIALMLRSEATRILKKRSKKN